MYDSMRYPYTIRELNKISQLGARFVLLDMWNPCHDPVRKSNFVGCFNGNMGNGKSLGMAVHCWLVDVDPKTEEHYFNIDKFHFSFKPFIKNIRSPDHIGEAFALDEMELQGHSRESFSDKNKILGNIFSTMRSRRQILLYSLPSERQLDSQLRTLRTARFEFQGVDPRGFSRFIYHQLKPNVRFAEGNNNMGETIATLPRIQLQDRTIKILSYKLRLPDCPEFKKLVHQYEQKKNEELDKVYDDIIARIDSVPAGEDNNKSIYQLVNEIEKDIDNYVDPATNNINPYYLTERLGISQTKANTIYREIKNRGKSTIGKFENLDVSDINHNYKLQKKRLQKLSDIYNH